MKKIIKNEQEFQDFCADVRNRQYETNPIKVDLSGTDSITVRFSPTSTYDWDNLYLEVLRIDNVDFVKLMNYNTYDYLPEGLIDWDKLKKIN